MPKALRISVSDHIARIPTAVRPTVRAARRAVRSVAPKAKEVSYQSMPKLGSPAMWKIARYAVDGEYIVALGTFTKHAHLFFYRGRSLDDGTGLLQGGGKELRFIKLFSPEDASRPEVRRTLRRAFALRSSIGDH